MKYALHVGINKYWPGFYGTGIDLQMCVKDADTMEAISSHLGVDEVHYMTDDHATRQRWLETVAMLAQKAKKGDLVFITQSSHGTYQNTNLGIEAQRSTAICMYDAPLWDYEVREAMKQFKSGVVVVWLTDCCFAESNWRLIMPAGKQKNLRSRFFKLKKRAGLKPTSGDKRQIRAIFFAYSSSNAYQVSYEDENGGVYTEAISQALRLEWPLSYYQLHQRASLLIAQEYPQTPVFEWVRAANYTGNPFLSPKPPTK